MWIAGGWEGGRGERAEARRVRVRFEGLRVFWMTSEK